MSCQLDSGQAKALLDRYVRSWDRSKPRSSSGTPRGRRSIQYASEAEWRRALPKSDTLWQKARSKGQLLAYLELAGGSIPARGIRCADGKFIQPDEQVMASFLDHRDVEFVSDDDDGYFRLTDDGRKNLKLFPPD